MMPILGSASTGGKSNILYTTTHIENMKYYRSATKVVIVLLKRYSYKSILSKYLLEVET